MTAPQSWPTRSTCSAPAASTAASASPTRWSSAYASTSSGRASRAVAALFEGERPATRGVQGGQHGVPAAPGLGEPVQRQDGDRVGSPPRGRRRAGAAGVRRGRRSPADTRPSRSRTRPAGVPRGNPTQWAPWLPPPASRTRSPSASSCRRGPPPSASSPPASSRPAASSPPSTSPRRARTGCVSTSRAPRATPTTRPTSSTAARDRRHRDRQGLRPHLPHAPRRQAVRRVEGADPQP